MTRVGIPPRPFRPYGPPRPTVEADWARYEACHLCRAEAGRACRHLQSGPGVELLTRPHQERNLRADRDADGVLVLSRRDHSATSQSRPSRVVGQAAHVTLDGVTVCGGELVAEFTAVPLGRVARLQRCQRLACRRIWLNDEVMA